MEQIWTSVVSTDGVFLMSHCTLLTWVKSHDDDRTWPSTGVTTHVILDYGLQDLVKIHATATPPLRTCQTEPLERCGGCD